MHTDHRVRDLAELDAPVIMLDTTPKGLLALAGNRLPASYRRALSRFRYGPGAAKADFLVSGPVPWTDPEVGRAGTVHLGGTRAETLAAENAAARGEPTDQPFVLLVDPAVADTGRAVRGRRPLWAYAHVPNGDDRDPVPLITRRIERYAPGFADTVIAARGISAAAYGAYNPNYPGGDIGAGAITLTQSVFRPVPAWNPYRTPLAACIPVFRLHSARTERARHVWLPRRPGRAEARVSFVRPAAPRAAGWCHVPPDSQENSMSTAHHTLAAEDFTGYLRTFHADAFDGSEPVEQVWDRYHLPEGTHVVNGKVWDRKKMLRDIESRRDLGAPYELHIHEVNVEGRLAAVRYTVSTPMMWKVQSATEKAVFAEIAEDGRVARTMTFATTG